MPVNIYTTTTRGARATSFLPCAPRYVVLLPAFASPTLLLATVIAYCRSMKRGRNTTLKRRGGPIIRPVTQRAPVIGQVDNYVPSALGLSLAQSVLHMDNAKRRKTGQSACAADLPPAQSPTTSPDTTSLLQCEDPARDCPQEADMSATVPHTDEESTPSSRPKKVSQVSPPAL